MIPLKDVDILGILVAPALLCLLMALLLTAVLRRGLDRAGIDRFVWNRALFDLSLLTCIASLLLLSLRFGAP